jgi:hypothetical protein
MLERRGTAVRFAVDIEGVPTVLMVFVVVDA